MCPQLLYLPEDGCGSWPKHVGASKLREVHLAGSKFVYFFPMAQQPLVGQGLLSIETSRPLSDTPHSVGLLWTSDRPVADTST
jgi:hypothetical protein